jgi:hypothetical protein
MQMANVEWGQMWLFPVVVLGGGRLAVGGRRGRGRR